MRLSKLVAWAGFFGAACALLALSVLQFMNPDMTRTRLVLTYWPIVVAAVVFALVAACGEYLSRRGTRRPDRS
jgi:hypothetical protein